MSTKRILVTIGDSGKDPSKGFVRQVWWQSGHSLHEGQGLDAAVWTRSWHKRQSRTRIIAANVDDGALVG